MKEQETRKLIKESMLKTSNDFTDQLITKIETINEPVRLPARTWGIAMAACVTFVLTAFTLIRNLPAIVETSMFQFHIPSIKLIMPIVTFVFLIAVNQLLILKDKTKTAF